MADGPRPEPEWLPVANPVEALVTDISLVAEGGRIVIFCGEAHPTIYNDPRFLKMAERVRKEKSALIEVITGPIMLVSDLSRPVNGVLDLWQKEVVTSLHQRRARFATAHFRVVETDLTQETAYRYYAEAPHQPLLPIKERRCENLDRLHAADVHQRALMALNAFDSWKCESVERCPIQHPTRGFADLPYVTTPLGLGKLMREAVEQGLVFKYLSAEEMLAKLPSAPKYLKPYPYYHQKQSSPNEASLAHR